MKSCFLNCCVFHLGDASFYLQCYSAIVLLYTLRSALPSLQSLPYTISLMFHESIACCYHSHWCEPSKESKPLLLPITSSCLAMMIFSHSGEYIPMLCLPHPPRDIAVAIPRLKRAYHMSNKSLFMTLMASNTQAMCKSAIFREYPILNSKNMDLIPLCPAGWQRYSG